MANLYLDHDVPLRAAELLRERGHEVATARDLGMESASDDVQLLTAYKRQAAMVTHNQKDFKLLHKAWHSWSKEWSVNKVHPGIILVRQESSGDHWSAAMIVERIQQLLD